MAVWWNEGTFWRVGVPMRRARRMMEWMFSDLDADLSKIRRVVLGREPGANVVFVCDDEELRLYVARRGPGPRRGTHVVAFPGSP